MSNPASSSGLLSADAAIMAMPGRLVGLMLYGDGTNAATITIYDHASAASGQVLGQLKLKAGDVSAELVISEEGIVANNGLYADVTGTGASYLVHYTIG